MTSKSVQVLPYPVEGSITVQCENTVPGNGYSVKEGGRAALCSNLAVLVLHIFLA